MLVLSLDTTTRAGSAAVVRDDRVVSQIAGDASRTHGERLPGDLMRAIEEANVSLGDIDLLAVAAGPGSFTGLRVGISAMQGLAMATGRRIVPVSALDALAIALRLGSGQARVDSPIRENPRDRRPVASGDLRDPRPVVSGDPRPPLIAPWIDAHRGEVFGALYDAAGTHPVIALIAPTALTPERTLEAWRDAIDGSTRVTFIGDGAIRYADTIRDRLGETHAIVEIIEGPPLAGVIGLIAAQSPDRAVLPHAVVPIYIRKPDAELARERRHGS